MLIYIIFTILYFIFFERKLNRFLKISFVEIKKMAIVILHQNSSIFIKFILRLHYLIDLCFERKLKN